MKRFFISILAVALLLSCACKGTPNETEIQPAPNPHDTMQELINTGEGEDIMNEPLLTKEDFLQKVSEYEEHLGVTVEDFKDIDVDDFIEQEEFSESRFEWYITGGRIFKSTVESYISNIEPRKIAEYRPQAMKVVDSTDEGYEGFKNTYFGNLANEPMYLNDFDFKLERYGMQGSEREFSFLLGRTQYIYQYERWEIYENPCHVQIPYSSDMTYGAELYLSKNGKYFIVFFDGGPFEVGIIKAFCEIED